MRLVFHVMYHEHCDPLSELYIVDIPPSTYIDGAARLVRRQLMKENTNVYDVVLIGQAAGTVRMATLADIINP